MGVLQEGKELLLRYALDQNQRELGENHTVNRETRPFILVVFIVDYIMRLNHVKYTQNIDVIKKETATSYHRYAFKNRTI